LPKFLKVVLYTKVFINIAYYAIKDLIMIKRLNIQDYAQLFDNFSFFSYFA